ncbi:unnamed protein product [Calicophoron daubneyi]|uniref:Uncharacterized protein n=1 Tax=Calicophoron daubneyi TaxID=300641 RepID=A0AAV2TNL9_CALDB
MPAFPHERRGAHMENLFTPSACKNDWFGTYINARLDCGQTIRSRCDVKSMTYCDLQSIDLNALNQVLEQYPAFKAEFTDYLYEDLSFNIQEGAEKYVDKDAIVIPAITLQLAQDNSPTSQDCFNPERRLSGVEYDGMETNSSCGGGDIERGTLQCGQPNSRATCTTKNRPKGSLHRFSESSVSSSDEMRYYPRRPSQVDKHQSKRRLRRATLGGLFNHQGKNRTEPSKNLIKTSENSPTIRRKSYSPGTDLVNNDFSTSIEPNSTSRTAVLVTELTKAVATVGDPTQLHPTKKSPAPPPQTSKTETSDQFLNVPKGISVGSTNKWNTGTSKHLISHGGTVQLGLKFCDKPSMPVVTPASSTSTPSIEDIKPFKQFTGNTLTVPDMSEAKKVSRSTLSLPLQPKIAAPPLEQYAPDTCRSQLNLGLLNIDQAKSFNPCSNDIMNRIIYQNQSLSNEMMRLHDRMGSLENQMAELLSSMKPNGVITR